MCSAVNQHRPNEDVDIDTSRRRLRVTFSTWYKFDAFPDHLLKRSRGGVILPHR